MALTCVGCPDPPHEERCRVDRKVARYWVACGCVQTGALPEPGERPVFGQHRLPRGERATQPWAASLATVERIVREDRRWRPVTDETDG